MWRASVVALALAAGVAAAEQPAPDQDAAPDTRTVLRDQLAAEATTIDRTLGIVRDKLGAVDTARARRLAAAYRVLSAQPGDDRMAAARRRAAARLLVERDLAERRVLAEEAAHLRAAAARATTTTEALAAVSLPAQLVPPAPGTIVRRFGSFVHDRSKATLTRRGLDLDVEHRAVVVAAADGIVRYVGDIRGLDRGVIIDHGSYLTLLAKLGDIGVPVGAPVRAGDRIGRAARRRIYTEVRVELGPGGVPIDPEPLMFPKR